MAIPVPDNIHAGAMIYVDADVRKGDKSYRYA